MKVSVIIPCYNIDSFIEKTINSILKQSFNSFEIILINDGSTDNTLSILNKLKAKDTRIRVFSQENSGVSAARNKGLNLAIGEYILFIDGDDTIEDDLLKDNISNMIINNYDLLIFGYKSMNCHGEVTKRSCNFFTETSIDLVDFKKYAENNEIINAPFNKVYKANIIRENNLSFPLGIKIGEDAIFNRNYIMHVKKIGLNPKIYYNYLVHDNSAMQNLDDDYHDQFINITSKVNFLSFFNIEKKENNFFVNNAYHKSNLVYKKNKNNYDKYVNKIISFKMYQKILKISFFDFLTLKKDEKVKYLLLRFLKFDFLIKKIKFSK